VQQVRTDSGIVRESVVRGTNRLGWIARKPSLSICERTERRPALTPSALSSAAIRREPYRRRCSSKTARTRSPKSAFSGLTTWLLLAR
jgi:hypothetical protein